MRSRGSRILAACATLTCMAAIAGCVGADQSTWNAAGVVTPSSVLTLDSGGSATIRALASNYDGTGIWSQPNCSHDCFQLDLVQNARGDLTLRDGFCAAVNCHVDIQLRRLGARPKAGATSEYHVSIVGLPGDERACINQEGSGTIDSASVPNTLTVTVSGLNWQGPEVGCQPETGTVVLQK